MKKTHSKTLYQVKQIIECNSLEAVNIFLQSGDWVLINAYRKRICKDMTYCIGRIADY